MYVSKVLKRKDASSLSIAVVMALAFTNFLSSVSTRPAELLSGVESPYGSSAGGFKDQYLYPLALLVVQLILLEISVRLIVWLRPMVVSKNK